MSAWAAFWIFAAVFVACDSWLYSKGHDTFLWQHKTPAELEIQRKQIDVAIEAKEGKNGSHSQ